VQKKLVYNEFICEVNLMTQYGIVLGGGGAKGSYEIGVWKALLELNIPICAVVGTSVGALNGAIMVQGNFDIAYKLWTNLDVQSVINLGSTTVLDYKKLKLKDLIAAARKFIENKGIDVTPLKKTLIKYIDETLIRQSPIDFGLVTFSLTDFKPVTVFKNEIPQGFLVDYLLASSCLPGFQTLEINNKKFIDGGIYDNIPISLILKKGIKDIIVVDVSGIGVVRKVNLKGLNLIYIKNSEPLCGTLQFDGEICRNGITMGYLDSLKVFGVLKGRRYFINDSTEQSKLSFPLKVKEMSILDSMLDLKANSIAANKIINYPLLRTLYKYAVGHLDSSNIIHAAAEIAAEVYGIERLKIYTWEELIEQVLISYTAVKISSTSADTESLIKNLLRSRRLEDLETLDVKGLASINTDFENQDVNSKLYRKVMAIFTPKICIANIFVSLMLWRSRE
jgi:NTE family protein